jgi:anion-transporting  ArsA/GET3 family ATPase
MLDPKLVADEAVRRIVKSPGDVEKLFQNRIYQHVTTMVAGMHEYTAMQALHRFVLEGRYDLVVLDTPPSRHALDFLEAPGRLSRFLDGRVFRMFMPSEKGQGGARRFAGGIVNRVLGGVLGEQFASDLAVFFGTFAGVLSTISRDVTGMREFLSGPDVAFLLITSPAPAALEEALFFQGKTAELRLPFKGYVLNRSNALGAENRHVPTLEALNRLAGPGGVNEAVKQALPKFVELADSELELIERDRSLLSDLAKRAGSGGFAEALPVLTHEGPEFEQLVTLSQHIS